MFANIFITLSSQKAIKSVFLLNSFWTLPYVGFISFVIFSACINWFNSLTPPIELYIPENIKPFVFLSSLYKFSSSNVVETTAPLSITTALKLSLILLDSTPIVTGKQMA